jgi:hypothetical protein
MPISAKAEIGGSGPASADELAMDVPTDPLGSTVIFLRNRRIAG